MVEKITSSHLLRNCFELIQEFIVSIKLKSAGQLEKMLSLLKVPNYKVMTHYPTDLTNTTASKNILGSQTRKRKHSLREIMNAILYINKSGC